LAGTEARSRYRISRGCSILDFYLKGLLLTAIICAIVALVTGLGEGGPESGIVTVIAIAGVSLTILVGFIKRVATSYTITDRRLHIKKGIVSRTIQETRLERVQNVNYQQGVIQRILQIGDVDFDTAAGDDYQFQFSGVAEPADVVHKVDEATHAADGGGLNPPARPADPATAPTQQQPPQA
jgi:uncharacterized membrane protein YdbT with pleckstrin-like domain